jgi:hypothetical protein
MARIADDPTLTPEQRAYAAKYTRPSDKNLVASVLGVLLTAFWIYSGATLIVHSFRPAIPPLYNAANFGVWSYLVLAWCVFPIYTAELLIALVIGSTLQHFPDSDTKGKSSPDLFIRHLLSRDHPNGIAWWTLSWSAFMLLLAGSMLSGLTIRAVLISVTRLSFGCLGICRRQATLSIMRTLTPKRIYALDPSLAVVVAMTETPMVPTTSAV